mmetsp:Transcript_9567/g.40086  ORF Transcript_9567/g.40086 Transcript_9567/m.40086 type:complete len:279 (+) Transcript_9567:828-1664(+)
MEPDQRAGHALHRGRKHRRDRLRHRQVFEGGVQKQGQGSDARPRRLRDVRRVPRRRQARRARRLGRRQVQRGGRRKRLRPRHDELQRRGRDAVRHGQAVLRHVPPFEPRGGSADGRQLRPEHARRRGALRPVQPGRDHRRGPARLRDQVPVEDLLAGVAQEQGLRGGIRRRRGRVRGGGGRIRALTRGDARPQRGPADGDERRARDGGAGHPPGRVRAQDRAQGRAPRVPRRDRRVVPEPGSPRGRADRDRRGRHRRRRGGTLGDGVQRVKKKLESYV